MNRLRNFHSHAKKGEFIAILIEFVLCVALFIAWIALTSWNPLIGWLTFFGVLLLGIYLIGGKSV